VSSADAWTMVSARLSPDVSPVRRDQVGKRCGTSSMGNLGPVALGPACRWASFQPSWKFQKSMNTRALHTGLLRRKKIRRALRLSGALIRGAQVADRGVLMGTHYHPPGPMVGGLWPILASSSFTGEHPRRAPLFPFPGTRPVASAPPVPHRANVPAALPRLLVGPRPGLPAYLLALGLPARPAPISIRSLLRSDSRLAIHPPNTMRISCTPRRSVEARTP